MYIQLMRRSYGLHEPIKHLEIPCDFSDIYLGENNINEDLLLEHIPEGWLQDKPSNVLITVANKNYTTGQYGLKKFKSWAKYFNAYVVELHRKPLDWWDEEEVDNEESNFSN